VANVLNQYQWNVYIASYIFLCYCKLEENLLKGCKLPKLWQSRNKPNALQCEEVEGVKGYGYRGLYRDRDWTGNATLKEAKVL